MNEEAVALEHHLSVIATTETDRDPYEELYFVEVVWANGGATRHLVSNAQLGKKFADWRRVFTKNVGARPTWVSMGDLTFYSQNVRSIELIETIVNEEG